MFILKNFLENLLTKEMNKSVYLEFLILELSKILISFGIIM